MNLGSPSIDAVAKFVDTVLVPVDVDGQICHFCSQVFVREQILVNKSDKSDHPHQREPWCFVEVVNKVGAEAMPKQI